MEEWYNRPGEPTYRYLKVKSVFLDPKEAIKIWERKIISKLDDPASWTASIDTDFEPYIVKYRTEFARDNDHISITVGLYGDGFHVITHFSNRELTREVFGKPNEFHLWTQETEEVPELIEDLLNRIEEFYEQ